MEQTQIKTGDMVYCVYELDDDELDYESAIVVGVGETGFWISTTADRNPKQAEYIGFDEVGEEIFFSESEAYEATQRIIQDRICDAYEDAKDRKIYET